jgi:hypothetical protein
VLLDCSMRQLDANNPVKTGGTFQKSVRKSKSRTLAVAGNVFFFVLVLSTRGTRTRLMSFDYEYDGKLNCETSKFAIAAY